MLTCHLIGFVCGGRCLSSEPLSPHGQLPVCTRERALGASPGGACCGLPQGAFRPPCCNIHVYVTCVRTYVRTRAQPLRRGCCGRTLARRCVPSPSRNHVVFNLPLIFYLHANVHIGHVGILCWRCGLVPAAGSFVNRATVVDGWLWPVHRGRPTPIRICE